MLTVLLTNPSIGTAACHSIGAVQFIAEPNPKEYTLHKLSLHIYRAGPSPYGQAAIQSFLSSFSSISLCGVSFRAQTRFIPPRKVVVCDGISGTPCCICTFSLRLELHF